MLADMPLYSVPSSYLLSAAHESIKLNIMSLIIPNLLLKYESDMMLILLKKITFNWSASVPTLLSKRTCTTCREIAGSCILNALWFIMCGHCATNILLSKICLLFFTMFLGGGGTQAVGADGPAGGPCGVLYGKNQRRGRRRVRRHRIFIQPPEMVD